MARRSAVMPAQKSESTRVSTEVPVMSTAGLPLFSVVCVAAVVGGARPLLYCELSPWVTCPELMRVLETP